MGPGASSCPVPLVGARPPTLAPPGQGERGEHGVGAGRLVDVGDRQVLVRAVHRRPARAADDRGYLGPEAGGVAEPALGDQPGPAGPARPHPAAHPAPPPLCPPPPIPPPAVPPTHPRGPPP